jgi:MFS family permease
VILTGLRTGPLAQREFRLLFGGRVVSMFGNQIAPIGLAFAVLGLTGSKSDLGLVLAARSLPQVLFLLFGGVLADRFPRHRVMVTSDAVSWASQGALAALLLSGHAQLWHLLALAAVNGASSAFFLPASSGIVPQTVPAEQLQQANALLRLGLNASAIIGPALGGILVAATSPGWALAADAASFALGALFVVRMRVRHLPQLLPPSMLRELAEGWREFRSRTWLWTIVLQFAVVNAAFGGALNVLGPVQAQRYLGGAAAFGIVLSAEAVGFAGGALLMLRFHPRRILLAATLGMLVSAAPLILLGIPTALVAITAAALVAGIGMEIFGVLWDTAMQQEIPSEKLSRVYSYDGFGSFVLVPVGLAVAGPIAGAVGIRTAIWGGAALIVAATLAVLFVRDVRELERKDVAAERNLGAV